MNTYERIEGWERCERGCAWRTGSPQTCGHRPTYKSGGYMNKMVTGFARRDTGAWTSRNARSDNFTIEIDDTPAESFTSYVCRIAAQGYRRREALEDIERGITRPLLAAVKEACPYNPFSGTFETRHLGVREAWRFIA